MRKDLCEKRDSIRPSLSLYPTFTDLRAQLGFLFWEFEAEKKRNPRIATDKLTSSARKPTPSTRRTTKKEKPKSNKRREELAVKGVASTANRLGIWE